MSRAPQRTRLLHVCIAAAVAVLGCESQAADLREWRPTDHDHTEDPGRDQVDVSDGGSTNPLAAHGISDVVLVAWRQKCTRCHGTIGRGDGPQAAMYQPPDLSDPARLEQLTDQAIAETIRTGRGKMPAFDLPDSTVDGLVKLIRLIGSQGEPQAAASGAPPGSAAPSPAASPGASKPPAAATGKAPGAKPGTAPQPAASPAPTAKPSANAP